MLIDDDYGTDDFYNDFFNDLLDYDWPMLRECKPQTKEPFQVEERLYLKDIKKDVWYETYNTELGFVIRTFQVVGIKDETLEIIDKHGNKPYSHQGDCGLAPYSDTGLWNPVNYTRLAK